MRPSPPSRPTAPAARAVAAAAAPLVAGRRAALAWRVLSCALLGAVLVLALAPYPPQEVTTGWDKANHALAFLALAFAWRLALPGGARRWLAVAVALAVVGGAIELAQSLVPGRQADAADLVADGLGAVAGLALAALVEWAVGARTRRG